MTMKQKTALPNNPKLRYARNPKPTPKFSCFFKQKLRSKALIPGGLNNLLLLICLLFFSSPLWAGIDNANALKPSFAHSRQCIRIVNALERSHYLEKKLDDALSSTIFDRYLKRLDPGKHLFTLDDINSFTPLRFRFDNALGKGDLRAAFRMFNLYITRSTQRYEYIISLIETWEKTLDLSKDETFVIDSDMRQWQPILSALYPLWKKELKNQIISMFLDDQDKPEITKSLERMYSNRLKRLLQTDANDIFQIFMNSVSASFDPHSQFFPPRASEDFDIHMSLSLEGIGAVLQTEYEYTKVIRLISKGPAEKSNLLMPGDKIIGVGQGASGEIKDTIGQRIDKVVKLIRGPKNSFVRLKIIPAKQKNATRTIRIKRDRVKLEDQSAKKKIVRLDHHKGKRSIGIIEIPNFYIDFAAYNRGDKDYKSTTKDVKKLLAELKEEEIDGLIIDLRDNGGGSLREASQLTGLFLKTGPTVQIKTKYRTSRLYDDDRNIEYTGPLIVLINRMSASASEIFAGAVKDYNRGVIVGTRSFGKGTVQELQPLGEGRLKLTSAKFYRVSGESTQNLGILPDITYPQIYRVEDTGESSLEGALPWDTTGRTAFKAYRKLSRIHKRLLKQYKKRSVKDPGFTYLQSRIEMASRMNSQSSVSLDLKQREARKKEREHLELDIENTYLKSIGKKPLVKMDAKETEINDIKEIIMDQTYLVMADFINLSEEFRYTW